MPWCKRDIKIHRTKKREEERSQGSVVARSFTGPCFNNWFFVKDIMDIIEGECYSPSDQAKQWVMPLSRGLNFKVKVIKSQRPIEFCRVQSRVLRKVILAFGTNLPPKSK